MKKLIFLLSLLSLIGLSFADWSDVINKEEQKVQDEKIKVINENFKLEKFSSQENFEKVLVEKLYDKVIESCKRNYYPYPQPLYRTLKGDIFAENDVVASEGIALKKGTASNSSNSSNISYGKTNLQKENVDEPEILKLTKDYIAYFNKANGKIYIIASPVANGKIDLNNVKITDTIKVPKLVNKNTIKLFYVNNQLVVIGTRYSKAFDGQITDLVFYKITNGKAKFSRLYDVKGNFKDARIVNNKIYLITNYSFSSIVRNICNTFVNKPLEKQIKTINSDYRKILNEEYKKDYKKRDYDKIDKLRKEQNEKIQNLIEEKVKNLDKNKILEKIKKGVSQKSIDIVVDKNAKFKYKGKIYPINIKLVNSALNNILFVPTNFDKLNIYDLKFNLVNIVDLNTKQNPNQYIIFGNIARGQIHMTTKSLYLVNNYYESTPWRCRPGLFCILPYYPRGNFTLIHKLSVDGFNLNYIDSQIVPGQPINQYSMDEDNSGNFRIFTKYYYPQRATDLYVFDKNLKLKGKIQGIAKGEDFKSSRFIEDKAYLVTFKATDPLFVIDLADLSNPKILGELKIPGYSLYLHPLAKIGNVQYLLGIGQQAEEVHGNWSLPKNIKIDVYKIDYSKKVKDVCSKLEGESLHKCLEKSNIQNTKCSDPSGGECPLTYEQLLQQASEDKNWNNIYVEQLYTYVLGNEKKAANGGSYTPVFNNPRTFVYDKNLKTLLLPVYLTEDKVEKRCYPKYIWKNEQRIEDGENCYDYMQKTPYFIGVKGLKIDLEKGVSEVLSKNYIDLYKNMGIGFTLNQWRYKSENHRVSYYKNGNDFVTFEINVAFADFFKGNLDKFIAFNKLFSKKVEQNSKDKINKKCFYKKPAPNQPVCQMYCGKRWVLENGKCIQIQVNAACSCPGFDTESQCKENCVK